LLLQIVLVLLISVLGIADARSATIAVFPLQELGESRNDVNLELTRKLAERLGESGSEIIGMDSLKASIGMNRIRTAGYLDTVNISRLRRDLGAAFVLLGTVSERKEGSDARIGLTLFLLRTSDARTVWSYVKGRSRSEERNVLAIGEPETANDLEELLIADLIRDWPWQTINEEQFRGALELNSVLLHPLNVRPGAEVSCRVRLENTWGSGQAPRVFFKANEQIHPAVVQDDGVTYDGSWVAGEEDGRVPVSLVLEWPLFHRTESALLGNYLVDGTLPVFDVELMGARPLNGNLVFDKELHIVPKMIVRKPMDRWRLSFYFEGIETTLGDMEGEGNLPSGFVWRGMHGMGDPGDGVYQIMIEVWDKAGNKYQVTKEVELLRSLPKVEVALTHSQKEIIADLDYSGKIPLSYWRLEMWTEEGKILTQVEGKDLPVSIDMQLPESVNNPAITGIIFTRDVFGKVSRQNVSHFLPKLTDKAQEEKDDSGDSESWVDEF